VRFSPLGLGLPLALGALLGCANIAGLSAFSKGECTDCVDASVDVVHPKDASTALDVAHETAPEDVTQPVEATVEAGDDSAAGDDGGTDASCGATDTILNCGVCGRRCDTLQSLGAACVGLACTYTGCAAGWKDCDNGADLGNAGGCETSLSSPENCTDCGKSCDTTHSVGPSCNGTTCAYSSCMPGWVDCNAKTLPNLDGCETDVTSVFSCGGCGNTCDDQHSTGASCDGTTCSYTGCAPGWADCKTAPPDTDGCETKVSTGQACGVCGQTCSPTHASASACDTTGATPTCKYTCAAGWADCNMTPPDTSGCNTSLSSPGDCGKCGQACDTTHSMGASCSGVDAGAALCKYTGCNQGWANCNTTAPDTNGCETSLASPSNCAKCNQACSTQTGPASCDGTKCSYTCNQGLSDCNGTTAPNTDGCECATPGCCGSGCQTKHNTGVSSPTNYFDCNATGNGQAQAMAACGAFMTANGGSPGACFQSQTGGLPCCCFGTAQSICGSAGNKCYCWQYGGPNSGTVQTINGTCKASCGNNNDPSWN